MMILLDSGPAGYLVHPNATLATVANCRRWAIAQAESGHRLALPGIIEYELRRELLRIRSETSLARLAQLADEFEYLPVTRDVLLKASELWAQARLAHHPAAHEERVDIDMILAAQAALAALHLPNVDIVIATTNAKHFAGIAHAREWQLIS